MLDFRGSHCLVADGAGFIGSNIVRTLLVQGADVTVIDDFGTGKREHLPESPNPRIVHEDLAVMADVGAVVAECDYAFHLAAQVSVVKSLEIAEDDARRDLALGAI